MSKPDDIPQDVWDAAINCSVDMKLRDMRTGEACEAAVIARAILAERERCKEIAALFIHRRLYKPNFPACSYHTRDVMEAMDSVTDADLAGYANDTATIRKGGD